MDYYETFEAALAAASREMDNGSKVARDAWHILMSGVDNADDTFVEHKGTDEAFELRDAEWYRIAYDSAAGLSVDPYSCSDDVLAWLLAHGIEG